MFLSVYFFLSGFCFATFASRIPTLKDFFGYNEAELGTILLFMPVSSLLGLPVSGLLVSRYDSRKPMICGLAALVAALLGIGLATSELQLIASLCLFAFSMRIMNIALNVQALALQKFFVRKINGSFHGLWSTGGIAGVGFSTFMVGIGSGVMIHFFLVSALTVVLAAVSFPYLLQNDRSTTGNRFVLGKPDPFIAYLGLLVFFAAICEGGMFDWSGIFFKDVVRVDLFTLGYLTFMICMALSRFASDRLLDVLDVSKTYILSASLIFAGVCLAILFPAFWPSIIGFCLVGIGTAAVIPVTFMLAATSRKYSPGMAISIIVSYGIAGTFIGPPLIGYLAHAIGLRFAFIVFGIAGMMIIPVSQLFLRHQRKVTQAPDLPATAEAA